MYKRKVVPYSVIRLGMKNVWDWCCHLYSSYSSASWCKKFHAGGWTSWFLQPLIYSHVSGLTRFCNGSDKGAVSNFVQIPEKVDKRPWQWLDKRSGKKTWVIHEEFKLTETKRCESDEEQSQKHDHNFILHCGSCTLWLWGSAGIHLNNAKLEAELLLLLLGGWLQWPGDSVDGDVAWKTAGSACSSLGLARWGVLFSEVRWSQRVDLAGSH
jgi:hypothetical protein